MQITGTIHQILTQKGDHIWAISPEATVYEAIKLMTEKNIGAVLVMRGERLVGVFSERDYTRKVFLKGKSSRETPVGDVITTPVLTVEPDEKIEQCMRLMTEHRVRHLPVLEHHRVIGIVSIGDLVNWIMGAQSEALNQMEDYISGKYPG